MELFKNNEELRNNPRLKTLHDNFAAQYGESAPYQKWTDEYIRKWAEDLSYYSEQIPLNGYAVTVDQAIEIAEYKIRYFEKGIIRLERQQLNDSRRDRTNLIAEHYGAELFAGINSYVNAQFVINSHRRHVESDYDERLAEAIDLKKEVGFGFDFQMYARATMKLYKDACHTKVIQCRDNTYKVVRKIDNTENVPITGKLADLRDSINQFVDLKPVIRQYIDDPEAGKEACKGIAIRQAKIMTDAIDGYLFNKTVEGLEKNMRFQDLDVPLNSKEFDSVRESIKEHYETVLLEMVEEKVFEIQGCLQRPKEEENTVSAEEIMAGGDER